MKPVTVQRWQGRASAGRCGSGEPRSRCRCESGARLRWRRPSCCAASQRQRSRAVPTYAQEVSSGLRGGTTCVQCRWTAPVIDAHDHHLFTLQRMQRTMQPRRSQRNESASMVGYVGLAHEDGAIVETACASEHCAAVDPKHNRKARRVRPRSLRTQTHMHTRTRACTAQAHTYTISQEIAAARYAHTHCTAR